MIKQISNLSWPLRFNSRFLIYNNYTGHYGSDYSSSYFNSDCFLVFEFDFSSLINNYSFSSLSIYLNFVCPIEGAPIFAYILNSFDFLNPSIDSLLSTPISSVLTKYGNHNYLFDLTDALSNVNANGKLYLCIHHNLSTNIALYISQEYAYSIIQDNIGFSPIREYKEFSLCNYQKSYVDLTSGKLFNFLNIYSIKCKNTTLSFPICFTEDTSNFKHAYQMSIVEEKDQNDAYQNIIIYDYTGYGVVYQFIDRHESGFSYLDYGITHENEQGLLFYSSLTNAYLFLDGSLIRLYDTNDDLYTFSLVGDLLCLTSILYKKGGSLSFSFDNVYHELYSITNDEGYYINLNYNGHNLSSIVFSDGTIINIAYDNANLRNVTSFSLSDLIEIDVKRYVISNIFDSIVDKKKNLSLTYSYSNNTVSAVSLSDSDDNELSHYSFSYHDNYAEVTDSLSHSTIYYFDIYKRLITSLDEKGNVISYNQKYVLNHLPSSISDSITSLNIIRNIIDNPTFELGLSSWNVSGSYEAKNIDEHLYGETSLSIQALSNLIISQNVNNPTSGTHFVKAVLKVINYTSPITISLKGVRQARVMRPEVPYDKTITISSLCDWEEFVSDSITISSSTVYLSMRVEINIPQGTILYLNQVSVDEKYQNERNNLITNGYFESSSILPWIYESEYNNDTSCTLLSQVPLDFASFLGNRCLKLSALTQGIINDRFKIRQIKQNVAISGKENESFIFSGFAKCNFISGIRLDIYLTFNYVNGQKETFTKTFAPYVSSYQLTALSVASKYSFSSIEVGVIYDGGDACNLDGFRLVRNKQAIDITQNDKQRITSINGNYVNYTSDNLVDYIFYSSGNKESYQYNSLNKISKIKYENGDYVEYSYNSEGDLIQETSSFASLLLNNYYSYDYDNRLITKVDEYNKTTYSQYDVHYFASKITYPNELEENYSYDSLGNIVNLTIPFNNSSYVNTSTYNYNNDLSLVRNTNSSNINYQYNSFFLLTDIYVCGENYQSFSYNNITHQLTELIYPHSNDVYSFIYDFSDIKEIKLNDNTLYKYSYNFSSALAKVEDYNSSTKIYYSYDINDNISQIYCLTYQINYYQNQVNYRYYNDYFSKSIYSSISHTVSNYYKDLLRLYSNDICLPIYANRGVLGSKVTINECVINKDNNIANVVTSMIYSYHMLDYKFSDIVSKNIVHDFDNTKSLFLWIKPKENNFIEYNNIFSFINSSSDIVSRLYISSSGQLCYIVQGENNPIYTSTSSINIDEWNFVYIKFYKDNSVSKIDICLNNEKYTLTSLISPNDISRLYVLRHSLANAGSGPSSYRLHTPIDIAMISIGDNAYNEDDIAYIYQAGKEAFSTNENNPIFSVSYINYEKYKNKETYQFNNSLISNYNNKIKEYSNRYSNPLLDSSYLFSYDQDLSRYVLSCFDDAYVAIKPNLLTSGSIQIRAKLLTRQSDAISTFNRVLFRVVDNDNNPILQVSFSKNQVLLAVNGSAQPSSYQARGSYINVVVTYDENSTKLYINGTLKTTSNRTISLENTTLYLGNVQNQNNTLYGYIDFINFTSDISTSLSTPVVVNNSLDQESRISSISYNNNYSISYSYNKYLIEEETHNNNKIYQYTYDDMGNVTLIKDENNNILHSYSYDKLSRLINDGNNTYSYDSNGNITSIYNANSGITKTYNYHSTIKDLLTSITDSDNNVLYSFTYSGLYPTSITKNNITHSLSWRGNSLINIDNNISYSYDHHGYRISKTVNNLVTRYIYEDNKLIYLNKQIDSNTSIEFIFVYNLNNQLVALQYNGKDYFYIHDALGNIISITNSSGSVLASYEYDAFGNIVSINHGSLTGDNLKVINNNPFFFKDYYYDEETSLYYLLSRYYNPEIGRFISPDSVDYIDPSVIGGINLYAYCGNDSVNKSAVSLLNLDLNGTCFNDNNHTNVSVSDNNAKRNFNRLSKLFGYELRESTGWDTSPEIATGWFGRIGFSSYLTKTRGNPGMFYAFAGSMSDVMNLFGTTYCAGVGINISDVFGAELQLETIGIGVQLSFLGFSVSASVNLIGATSLTFALNNNLGNGTTYTNGFTISINTGALVMILVWIYKAVTTGDTSPVPGFQPI